MARLLLLTLAASPWPGPPPPPRGWASLPAASVLHTATLSSCAGQSHDPVATGGQAKPSSSCRPPSFPCPCGTLQNACSGPRLRLPDIPPSPSPISKHPHLPLQLKASPGMASASHPGHLGDTFALPFPCLGIFFLGLERSYEIGNHKKKKILGSEYSSTITSI